MPIKTAIDIIHSPKKGWLKVGRTRMVLFDIMQGFYNLGRVINKEVGDNSPYVIFQAGIKGGTSFLGPMIRGGRLEPGPEGFATGLSVLTDGGFGHFEIKEMKWEEGWAVVDCFSSVEGWVYARKRRKTGGPVCNYARGIILGFMKATHKYAHTGLEDELDCVETNCQAIGHGSCRFVIGTREKIKKRGLPGSRPGKSIRQQLKEMVWEKTKEIRQANRFKEKVFSNAPIGILTLNKAGVVTSSNPAAAKILKIPHRKIQGIRLLHQDVIKKSELALRLKEALKEKEFDLVDFPLGFAGQRIRFVSIKGIPLKTRRGVLEGVLCLLEDTTEKTLSAQKIEYLNQYNENIIQSITDGIMVLDPEFRIQTWNLMMENIFRLKAKRVQGKPVREIDTPFSDSSLFKQLKEVIKKGNQKQENAYRYKNPKKGTLILNIKMIPLHDESRKVTGIIVLMEDITAKEKVEIRYQNLFETAKDGICLINLKGQVLSANQQVLQTLETSWDALQRRSLSLFLPSHEKARFRSSLKTVTRQKEVEPYELEFIGRKGRRTPVELNITPVRKEDKTFGLHIIGRDITKRKKMEQHIIQASKLAAVGELASGVAHEINNPLASVTGYAEEMYDIVSQSRGIAEAERRELKEGLVTIIEQAQRCKEITQGLLNFARHDMYQRIPTDINDLLEKTLFLLEPDIKISRTKIIKKLYAGLPLLETDPSQLQQVFLNLIKNALDAVESNGNIKIISARDNQIITIQIKDNGCGISSKNLKKLFTPFFTTKPTGKGTGLGLSICYKIVERLNGKIFVESKEGEGATFTMQFPLREA